TMQFDFEKKDKRCTMRVIGIELTGKWTVIRNRNNDAILVLVDYDESRGGKGPSQSAFEITPVDADHIILVDVKDPGVRMKVKRVDSSKRFPTKAENTTPKKPPVKKPDEQPTKKPDELAGPKYPLVLKGNNGPITGLSFTADGGAVATAS